MFFKGLFQKAMMRSASSESNQNKVVVYVASKEATLPKVDGFSTMEVKVYERTLLSFAHGSEEGCSAQRSPML